MLEIKQTEEGFQMHHAYLSKKDIDVARVLKQITRTEVKELLKTVERCTKSKQVGNIILHNVA